MDESTFHHQLHELKSKVSDMNALHHGHLVPRPASSSSDPFQQQLHDVKAKLNVMQASLQEYQASRPGFTTPAMQAAPPAEAQERPGGPLVPAGFAAPAQWAEKPLAFQQETHSCPIPMRGHSFEDFGHLERHVGAHAGERPHGCSLCSKAFSPLDDLSRLPIGTPQQIYVSANGTHAGWNEPATNLALTVPSSSGGTAVTLSTDSLLSVPFKHNNLALPSGPLLFPESGIESRVAELEYFVSVLEDRVDSLDPDRFTPPASATSSDYMTGDCSNEREESLLDVEPSNTNHQPAAASAVLPEFPSVPSSEPSRPNLSPSKVRFLSKKGLWHDVVGHFDPNLSTKTYYLDHENFKSWTDDVSVFTAKLKRSFARTGRMPLIEWHLTGAARDWHDACLGVDGSHPLDGKNIDEWCAALADQFGSRSRDSDLNYTIDFTRQGKDIITDYACPIIHLTRLNAARDGYSNSSFERQAVHRLLSGILSFPTSAWPWNTYDLDVINAANVSLLQCLNWLKNVQDGAHQYLGTGSYAPKAGVVMADRRKYPSAMEKLDDDVVRMGMKLKKEEVELERTRIKLRMEEVDLARDTVWIQRRKIHVQAEQLDTCASVAPNADYTAQASADSRTEGLVVAQLGGCDSFSGGTLNTTKPYQGIENGLGEISLGIADVIAGLNDADDITAAGKGLHDLRKAVNDIEKGLGDAKKALQDARKTEFDALSAGIPPPPARRATCTTLNCAADKKAPTTACQSVCKPTNGSGKKDLIAFEDIKVSPMGELLNGGKYKTKTFKLPMRGSKLFMVAECCAYVAGFETSEQMFRAEPALHRFEATDTEKQYLIDAGVIDGPWMDTMYLVITRVALKVFGNKLIAGHEVAADERHTPEPEVLADDHPRKENESSSAIDAAPGATNPQMDCISTLEAKRAGYEHNQPKLIQEIRDDRELTIRRQRVGWLVSKCDEYERTQPELQKLIDDDLEIVDLRQRAKWLAEDFERSSRENAQLLERINKADAELVRVAKTSNDDEFNIGKYERQIKVLQQRCMRAAQKSDDNDHKIRGYEEEIEMLQQRCIRLASELDEQSRYVTTVPNELFRVQNVAAAKQEEIIDLRSELGHAVGACNDAGERAARLAEELEKLQALFEGKMNVVGEQALVISRGAGLIGEKDEEIERLSRELERRDGAARRSAQELAETQNSLQRAYAHNQEMNRVAEMYGEGTLVHQRVQQEKEAEIMRLMEAVAVKDAEIEGLEVQVKGLERKVEVAEEPVVVEVQEERRPEMMEHKRARKMEEDSERERSPFAAAARDAVAGRPLQTTGNWSPRPMRASRRLPHEERRAAVWDSEQRDSSKPVFGEPSTVQTHRDVMRRHSEREQRQARQEARWSLPPPEHLVPAWLTPGRETEQRRLEEGSRQRGERQRRQDAGWSFGSGPLLPPQQHAPTSAPGPYSPPPPPQPQGPVQDHRGVHRARSLMQLPSSPDRRRYQVGWGGEEHVARGVVRQQNLRELPRRSLQAYVETEGESGDEVVRRERV